MFRHCHRCAAAVFALVLGFGAGAWSATAQAPPGTRPKAATPAAEPEEPAWLAPLRDRGGKVSWRAITIGMEMREIAALLRVALRTELVMEVGCGGDALEIVVDGVKILMGFEGHTRESRLHTLFVFVEPAIDANTAVAGLKRRLPELMTRPGVSRLHDSGDSRPAYRIGDPEVALMVDPRGIWISHPSCLD